MPAARDVVGPVGILDHHDRHVGRDAGRGLGGHRAGDLDPAGGDELAGVLTRAGQATSDQLGVESEATRWHGQAGPVGDGWRVQRPAQLVVGRLEDAHVLLERTLLERLDGNEHLIDRGLTGAHRLGLGVGLIPGPQS